MKEPKYKIVIDKEVLYEFLIIPNEEIEEAHLVELRKVFEVVLLLYYAKYVPYSEELYSYCQECVLERKAHYEPKYSAYNFIYTMFRNQVGNYVRKHRIMLDPEINVSQEYDLNKDSYEQQFALDEDSRLDPIKGYEEYLMGATDYNYIRIPIDKVISIAHCLLSFSKSAVKKAPKDYDRDILYTILKSVIQ